MKYCSKFNVGIVDQNSDNMGKDILYFILLLKRRNVYDLEFQGMCRFQTSIYKCFIKYVIFWGYRFPWRVLFQVLYVCMKLVCKIQETEYIKYCNKYTFLLGVLGIIEGHLATKHWESKRRSRFKVKSFWLC